MSPTLLIVDDNLEILQIMKQILSHAGYGVLTAASGTEAIEIVRGQNVSAVLLDLTIPDVSGLEVLKEIKRLKPALPVIMVTGNHEEEEAQRAIDLGAWDYLTKPIDFDYLKKVLNVSIPKEPAE